MGDRRRFLATLSRAMVTVRREESFHVIGDQREAYVQALATEIGVGAVIGFLHFLSAYISPPHILVLKIVPRQALTSREHSGMRIPIRPVRNNENADPTQSERGLPLARSPFVLCQRLLQLRCQWLRTILYNSCRMLSSYPAQYRSHH